MFKGDDFPKHHRVRLVVSFATSKPGWTDLAPKLLRLTQIGQIRAFSVHNSVHFGSVCENVLKCDLKRSQICPIWEGGNLTHIGTKFDIHVPNNSLHTTRTDARRGSARHTYTVIIVSCVNPCYAIGRI